MEFVSTAEQIVTVKTPPCYFPYASLQKLALNKAIIFLLF
jgi:hypothetical protein